MKILNKCVGIFFVFLFALVASGQTSKDRVQTAAELFVSAYNAKNYEKIYENFDAQMKKVIPFAGLTAFLDDGHSKLGKITQLGLPDYTSEMSAVFPVQFEQAVRDLNISLDANGKINGLQIKAPRPKTFTQNKISLRLPFEGEWFILWGGDKVSQNYHQDFPNQRFAFDIIVVDKDGNSYQGDGTKNENYFAFGRKIISPADGIVTDVVNGVRDNIPGNLNPLMALGNVVKIKHTTGEFSVFAHLKLNSIQVKVGDNIKVGQTIGLCGNSGNSSEPHLHYQLQKSHLIQNEGSIKVFFDEIKIKRNGKIKIEKKYSPVKGDIVSN